MQSYHLYIIFHHFQTALIPCLQFFAFVSYSVHSSETQSNKSNYFYIQAFFPKDINANIVVVKSPKETKSAPSIETLNTSVMIAISSFIALVLSYVLSSLLLTFCSLPLSLSQPVPRLFHSWQKHPWLYFLVVFCQWKVVLIVLRKEMKF